jgi:hypothetical protein
MLYTITVLGRASAGDVREAALAAGIPRAAIREIVDHGTAFVVTARSSPPSSMHSASRSSPAAGPGRSRQPSGLPLSRDIAARCARSPRGHRPPGPGAGPLHLPRGSDGRSRAPPTTISHGAALAAQALLHVPRPRVDATWPGLGPLEPGRSIHVGLALGLDEPGGAPRTVGIPVGWCHFQPLPFSVSVGIRRETPDRNSVGPSPEQTV